MDAIPAPVERQRYRLAIVPSTGGARRRPKSRPNKELKRLDAIASRRWNSICCPITGQAQDLGCPAGTKASFDLQRQFPKLSSQTEKAQVRGHDLPLMIQQ